MKTKAALIVIFLTTLLLIACTKPAAEPTVTPLPHDLQKSLLPPHHLIDLPPCHLRSSTTNPATENLATAAQ
jgi:hypothetical protein